MMNILVRKKWKFYTRLFSNVDVDTEEKLIEFFEDSDIPAIPFLI